jgi:hypothetical protein
MKKYNKDDVINELLKLANKQRLQVVVDQRSYLIAILIYKFSMTEQSVADATGLSRIRVHYNKKLAINFYEHVSFQKHTEVYQNLFPFDFNAVADKLTEKAKTNRKNEVTIFLDDVTFSKLKDVGAILGHAHITATMKLFIEKGLRLWEK